jgi:hypothetical protein
MKLRIKSSWDFPYTYGYNFYKEFPISSEVSYPNILSALLFIANILVKSF